MKSHELVPHRCPVCLAVTVSHTLKPHHHGREVPLVPYEPVLSPEPLVALEHAVHRIVPYLRNRNWPHTTTMLIPSMLVSAALLRCRLRASAAEDPGRAAALEACVADLVRAFCPRPRSPTLETPPPKPTFTLRVAGGPHAP